MKLDFFQNLPSEIITNILSRLSVRSIAICKCVCKPWLHLLETDDFVKSHLSKSTPALAVKSTEEDSNWCKMFELVDEVDLERLAKIGFPHSHGSSIEGSANGLLLLRTRNPDSLHVCNPIACELCELHSVPDGFGTSRVSGQHKVVCMNHSESDCHVYTLGTGSSWRRVEFISDFYDSGNFGAFVNGNLHWLVFGVSFDIKWVSCFDVETECFSTYVVLPNEELLFLSI